MTQWRSWDWRLCAWWVGVSVVVSIGLVPIWKWLYTTLSSAHYPVSAELVPFLLMGLAIGIGQWLALHHRLRLGKMGWWLAGGIVDGFAFLGVFLVRAADNSSGPDVYLALGMLGGTVGAIAGLIQWGALRETVWWARWWIAVSIAGYAIGWPIGVFVGVVVGSALFGPAWNATAGWIGAGIVTGTAVTWLMRRPNRRPNKRGGIR